MDIKFKICGMRDAANIASIAALQPDYMGFIFYDKSPRYVTEDFTLPRIDSGIRKVGVFVNEGTELILRKVEQYKLDFVQLHGTESVEQCAEVSQKVDVIKAFSIDETFDFDALKPFENHVTYFLFDTKGRYFGGNAKTFDWNLLKKYNQQVPFFLSGGITPENVSNVDGLRNLNIHAIDVNSGVEDAPGIKNSTKIKMIKSVLHAL